jgi:hypothetical protein
MGQELVVPKREAVIHLSPDYEAKSDDGWGIREGRS